MLFVMTGEPVLQILQTDILLNTKKVRAIFFTSSQTISNKHMLKKTQFKYTYTGLYRKKIIILQYYIVSKSLIFNISYEGLSPGITAQGLKAKIRSVIRKLVPILPAACFYTLFKGELDVFHRSFNKWNICQKIVM